MRSWLAGAWTLILLYAAVAAAADMGRAGEAELTPIAVAIGVAIYALRTLYESLISPRTDARRTDDSAIVLEAMRNLAAYLTAHTQREEQWQRDAMRTQQEWQTQQASLLERIVVHQQALESRIDVLCAEVRRAHEA